jgi:hypothetical protein
MEVACGCGLAGLLIMAGVHYTELPVIGKIECSPFVGRSAGDIFPDKVMKNMPL